MLEGALRYLQLGKVPSSLQWFSKETRSLLNDHISFLAEAFDFQSSALFPIKLLMNFVLFIEAAGFSWWGWPAVSVREMQRRVEHYPNIH